MIRQTDLGRLDKDQETGKTERSLKTRISNTCIPEGLAIAHGGQSDDSQSLSDPECALNGL